MALCINLVANKEFIELLLKIAVAIGGAIWAYYLLGALRQRELAKITEVKGTVETERLRIELRTLAAEKEAQLEQLKRTLELKTIVVVDIQHTVVPNPDGVGFIVLGVVELTNQGNLDTKIDWYEQRPAIQMSRVKFDADGRQDFDHQTETRVRSTLDPKADARAHIVRSGGKEAVVFAVYAPVAGLYLLRFRAESKPYKPKQAASGGPHEPSQTAGGGRELPLPWTGNKYIRVGDASLSGAAADP